MRRRSGMTLIEIMVAMTILSILALAMLTATISLTRSTNVATVGLDLDRDADRFLAEFRREVRQSGYFKYSGTTYPQLWVGGAAAAGDAGTGTSLRLRRRVGGDPFVNPSTGVPPATLANCAAMWIPAADGTQWIEYSREVDPVQPTFTSGATRYKVVRRFADTAGTPVNSTDVLNNVEVFNLTLIVPGGTGDSGAQNTMGMIEVDMKLAKVDPSRTDKIVLTSRQYLERVRAQNPR